MPETVFQQMVDEIWRLQRMVDSLESQVAWLIGIGVWMVILLGAGTSRIYRILKNVQAIRATLENTVNTAESRNASAPPERLLAPGETVLTCLTCGQRMFVSQSFQGRSGRCSRCQAEIPLPDRAGIR